MSNKYQCFVTQVNLYERDRAVDEKVPQSVSRRHLPQIHWLDHSRQGNYKPEKPKVIKKPSMNTKSYLLNNFPLRFKVGDVRLKCLQTLQPLYGTEELKSKLELFTSKFKVKHID